MNSSLNHIYRVVWNASLGLWQVASEVARNGGKTQSEQRKTRRVKVGAAAVAGAFAGLASLVIPSIAFAQLPTGGQVVGGQASIVQSGNALNINQTTDRAAIDWQSFNVGQGNTVNFNQPNASSIALNRVLGSDVSVIQGAINANGQVFLVNQNGILFTPTAQVNVGGIVASTRSISTADFMAGKHTFSGNSTGTVENQGSITTATGGTVALIAAKIINTGTITAPQGTVGLAAGNTVTLDLGGPVKIQVTEGALNTAIEQGGGIVADGGQIYLTAKAAGNLAASVINHTGITRARTLAGNQKGQIILIADMEVGSTTVAGTLDASAPNGGDGGFIETSAANVKIQDGVNITTQSAQGKNGQWLIDPHDFTIAASGGDITGAALGTALQSNSVTIQTLASSVSCTGAICGMGKADGNGDIFVNDAINAGTSNNTLTLQAHRDINVNKAVTVGGLNLTAVRNVNVNDVVTVNNSLAVNYGANSDFTPNTSVRPTDNGALNMKLTPDGFVGKINLGSSATVNLNGSTYTVIRDRAGLEAIQGGSIAATFSPFKYVLGNDIDLQNVAWTPTATFQGSFDGLGHKVTGLSVNSTDSNVGFFRFISRAATSTEGGNVANFGVEGSVTGSNSSNSNIGGLAGSIAGAFTRNIYSKVNVTGAGTPTMVTAIGGMFGSVSSNSRIQNAFASGAVTTASSVTQINSIAGGFLGLLNCSSTAPCSIDRVFSTGNVNGGVGLGGGLIGRTINVTSATTITNVYATGDVAGNNFSGGLIGQLSTSTGAVSPTITNAFASGIVSGPRAGTLIGRLALGATSNNVNNVYVRSGTLIGEVFSTSAALDQAGITVADFGNPAQTYPNLDANVWSFVNGTPVLKLFAPMVTSTPIFIRLDCGLCESIYGETPELIFKAFDTASGGMEVSNAMLAGSALYSLTNGGVAAGTVLGKLTDAGTYSVTYTSGLTGASMYQLSAGAATNFTIKPKLLTVAIQAALGSPLSKVYDGNENIALAANNFAISGFVDQQGVGATLGGVTSGTFNSKNVLQATTVTADVSKATLSGTAEGFKASNYSLPTSPVTAAGTITAKGIAVTGLAAQNKTYDGNRTAVVTGTAVVDTSGVIQGDTVSVTGTVTGGLFADKDAGIDKAVSVSGLSLSGTDAGNYAIAPANLKANIAQKALTITGTTVANKDYNGNTNATVTAGTLSGVVEGETLGSTTATGQFAGKDVVRNTQGAATAQNVTVAYTLANGANAEHKASNYTLAGETKTATINPKALTIAGSTAANKTYDGNTAATVTAGTLSGLVGGETLGATTATGQFADKNAGTGKNVTVVYTLVDGVGSITAGAPIFGPGGSATSTTPIVTPGAKASNYSLASETLKADIAQKQVSITEFAASNKTYDGNTTATISNAGKLNGVLEGDAAKVALTNTGATFDTKDAGTAKTVTLNGKALTGDEAKNYVLASDAVTTKADIAQKQLTVTGFAADNKTYDGNTTATISNAGTLNGVVQGDAGKVALNNTGATFDTKDAGTAKTVTLNGKTLSGDEAKNYVLATTPVTAQANIAQKQLTIAEFAASNKVYDGNTTATIANAGKLVGVVEGDTGKVALGNTGATFDTKNAGTGKTVTLNGANITGTESANYTLAPTAVTAKADIAKKEITLAGFDAANKVYDGNTTAQIVSSGSLTGVVEKDAVTVSNSGATFDTKNAGTGKTVTLNGVALSGTDAGNYSIANTATDTADIEQKQLTVTGFAAGNKTYDGNTTATISNAGTLNGVVQSDAGKVALNNTGATFDTKDAGTAKTVTLNGKTLTGDEAKNYVLATTPVTAQANIAQKQLTIAEFAASNKVYDGNTTATIANAGKLVGVVEGDTGKVALGNTGATFDTKNAGTGKTVTLNGASISGTESANYLLAPTAVTAKADIAKKEITLAGFDAANKVYDGNTTAQIVSSGSLTGVVEKDAVTVSNSGATFDTKNAGTGKTVTLNGVALGGSDAGNYSIANTATDTADIAQKQLTVTGFAAGNKTYDGNTAATIFNAGTLSGVVQSDAGKVALNNTGATFDTKDAGTAKTVTLNGKTLSGDEAKNYVLATTPVTTQADITRLASVTWIGGATGNWFDAANWAGGAVPDLSNVASVVLPANVKVNFNGAMDAVMIDTLGASGALDMASGTLNVGTGGITLSGFNQTGGTLSTTGNFNVTQTEGPIQLGQLTVGGTLNVQTNGAISQLAGSVLKATGAASFAAGKNAVTLANTGNDFGSVGVTGTTVSITDTNAIALDAINATSLIVKAGGAVTQNAAAIVSGTTNVDATGFDVTLNAKGNDLNVLSAKAKGLTVSDEKGGIILGSITATGNTSVTSAGGDIIQGDNGESLVLTGTLTLNAKDGEITAAVTLNGGNNTFTGAVSATGSTVSLKAKGAMSAAVTATDATLNAGGNLAVSGMVSKGLTTTTTGTDSTTTFGNTTVGGDLSVTSTGNVAQQAMTTLSVTGKTTVTATGKDVSLGNAGNDFGTVSATSKDLTIADAKGGVVLDKITATGNTSVTSNGGAITQAEGSVISATGTTALSAKDGENTAAVTLNGTNNIFTGAVNATGSAVNLNAKGALTAAVTATEATLSAAGNLGVSGTVAKGLATTTTGMGSTTTFGTTSVGTDLSVTSTGKVAQLDDKATLSVANKATIAATDQDVTLANAGNNFGSVGVTGAAVSIADTNAVALDAISATSLTVKAGGAVTQVADKALEVTGATSVDAGTNNVTLSNAGNDFSTVAITAGAASVTDKNAVALDNIKAAGLALKAGGAVTQVADKALEVTGATSVDAGANNVTLANAGNDFNTVAITAGAASVTDKNAVALDNIKAASLALKAGGAVTQVADKSLEVTGATTVDAGTNNVTLANAGNDFNTVAITAGAASVTDKNAVALDNIKAASLTLIAGGAVTQVADKALEVTGATTVDAGTNNVTLANANNDFGSIGVSAGAASITDKNAVALDNIKAASLAVKAGGAVTQVADKALEVTGATTVDAGANNVTLANANNDFGSIGVSAGAASITDKNAVALDNIKAASLAVKAGGAVTQVADKVLEVTGATSVDAGTNNVTLANAGSDFNTVAITAGAASVTDKNAVTLDNIKAASLALKAGGAVTQVAEKVLEVTGATTVDAGANNVTLANAGNDFNRVAITAGAASVTDKNAVALDNIKAASLTLKAGGAVTQVVDKALEVTGLTSVDAGANDVTLANTNNDFGSIGVTAKAASIVDKNAVALDNIKAASLAVKAGGAVTQVADKALEVTGATTVDAGTNNVTLANANNDFGSIGVSAGAATITDKNAVALDNIKAASLAVKAGGAVTQMANKALEVTGVTTVDAGENNVTLANAGNDFNTVAITAGAASVTDKNAVALDNIKAASLALKAGGAVTQVADKALEVTGLTSVDAGANDVTLANANNDFGSIGVSAGAASITDKNAVVLDNTGVETLELKAGGAIEQNSDSAVLIAGRSSFDAPETIDLPNLNNRFGGAVSLRGTDVSLGSDSQIIIGERNIRGLKLFGAPNRIDVADSLARVSGITQVESGNQTVSAPATTGPDSLTSRPDASESNSSAEPLFVFADVVRTVPSGQVLVIDGGINVNFAGTSASGSNNNSGNTSDQQ